MNEALESLKKQHVENYKKAILEYIKNNTEVLFNEDIMSLIKTPPLDSMDTIKCKFLDLAKKYKIVLDTNELAGIVANFRSSISTSMISLKEKRISILSEIVFSNEKEENHIFKLNKKDFSEINKVVKKEVKQNVLDFVEKELVKKIDVIFNPSILEVEKKKFVTEIFKYFKGAYLKQLLENIDFKILVKDMILINGIKEQGERHLFTIENSRIFNG